MISVKSYLPPEKRVRSKLQQVKDKHRSFMQTMYTNIITLNKHIQFFILLVKYAIASLLSKQNQYQ